MQILTSFPISNMGSVTSTSSADTKVKNGKFKWIVEFEVDECWVADGFELTDERALDMLASDLRYANIGIELGAKVLQGPSIKDVRIAQGYES